MRAASILCCLFVISNENEKKLCFLCVWCVESVRNEKISESDTMQVCVLIDSAQELNIFSVFLEQIPLVNDIRIRL